MVMTPPVRLRWQGPRSAQTFPLPRLIHHVALERRLCRCPFPFLTSNHHHQHPSERRWQQQLGRSLLDPSTSLQELARQLQPAAHAADPKRTHSDKHSPRDPGLRSHRPERRPPPVRAAVLPRVRRQPPVPRLAHRCDNRSRCCNRNARTAPSVSPVNATCAEFWGSRPLPDPTQGVILAWLFTFSSGGDSCYSLDAQAADAAEGSVHGGRDSGPGQLGSVHDAPGFAGRKLLAAAVAASSTGIGGA